MKPVSLNYFSTILLSLAVVGWSACGRAAENSSKPDPTGVWKVICTRDGKTQSYQPTLKLKCAQDKWTGTYTRRHDQKDIEMVLEDVKLKGNEISFTVTIPSMSGAGVKMVEGAKMIRKFRGKIVGDTLKDGTVKEEWMGEDPLLEHPLHWEATRIKDGAGKRSEQK